MTMFYFLSKSLFFLLQPSVWIMGLVLWALIERRASIKRKLLISALTLFFFFGNAVVFNELMSALEPDFTAPSKGKYSYAVILGGYADRNSHGAEIELYRSSDRITKGLELYKEGIVRALILSSGVHPEGHPEWNEAQLSADWLMACGVPEEDLLLEDRSWNTFQNALYTAVLLDSLEIREPLLVITSASHVHRAEACFIKQGLTVEMLAVDHYSGQARYGFWDFILPSMRTVIDWEVPIKEKVGFLIYSLQGYC